MPNEALLNSWKEIALYMGRSERTVQRWEKRFGLPVRRPAGRARSAVIALPSEIQAWFQTVPAATLEVNGAMTCTNLSRMTKGNSESSTLLCIDNHPEGLLVRKALLEAAGYTVLTAPSGRSGLKLFEDHHVDLVVLDYSMPDLDGETVAQRLHECNPRIPILLISGAVRSIPSTLLNAVNNFVQKRQPVEMLLAAVGELFGSRLGDIGDRSPGKQVA